MEKKKKKPSTYHQLRAKSLPNIWRQYIHALSAVHFPNYVTASHLAFPHVRLNVTDIDLIFDISTYADGYKLSNR